MTNNSHPIGINSCSIHFRRFMPPSASVRQTDSHKTYTPKAAPNPANQRDSDHSDDKMDKILQFQGIFLDSSTYS